MSNGRKVKMPRKKPKKDLLSFHRYVLDLNDQKGKPQRYIIHSIEPLFGEKSPKSGEAEIVKGVELFEAMGGERREPGKERARTLMNLSFAELDRKKAVYIKKSTMLEGKPLPDNDLEVPVNPSEANYVLNQLIRESDSVNLVYDGKVGIDPKKEFNLLGKADVNPFTRKTKRV